MQRTLLAALLVAAFGFASTGAFAEEATSTDTKTVVKTEKKAKKAPKKSTKMEKTEKTTETK